ncbi:NAD(P)-dependent oxidoreductase [Methylobacterium sp. NEAU 140]|uniref:NAD-dependent epimerase/dehydratase family protein n=1 Tax=Methylobacterium sp. NEAU 140 TaxID=3064945 RepID=UPI0027351627|nr:NAD(P)-dependent oxidoreductase [Methylobacterium sp. NEAU 140]MDP4023365.1 NAD(P)-dependent oxidoreductase [Methylobacterium sp. NEAU 140]
MGAEEIPNRPVLLTGASGALGRILARALAARGWSLWLTDRAPFPDPVPAGARFTRADLEDGPMILRLAEGCGTIVHLGGVSVEQPFETVIGPNLRGLYHVYEAARREGARVVFASSNHAVGFRERAEVLDDDCALAPDGFYGLSKAYGELMGRLYRDKHGVESVVLRIGSCFPEPTDARMLATWLSAEDLVRLIARATLASDLGPEGRTVIWATSNNSRMTWWRRDGRDVIGWAPQDSADPFIPHLEDRTTDDRIVERYQGGAFTAIDYSRDGGRS